MKKALLVVCSLGLVVSAAFAQTVSPQEPEVRRALPADAPNPNLENRQNPEWMNRVQQPPAAATPQQPFRPDGRIESALTPFEKKDDSVSSASPSATPLDQTRRVLDLANSLYARKMYDLAIPEYEIFLVSSGGGESRDAALFRLAECHRMLGNLASARAGYEKLLMEFQKGEFAGAGACRLGEFLFAEKLYDAAHVQYEIAAREAKEAEVRLTAKYFSARSLDYMKRNDEARAAYRAVIEVEGKNPYRDHALMALGDIEVGDGKKEAGLSIFEKLASSNAKSAIVAEAAVKAAVLAAEFGQKDKALALFDKAAKMSDAQDWKPAALIGAMRLRYQANDYRGVVNMGIDALKGVPVESRPEALQILAASYRQLGNNLEARRTYDVLLRDFPDVAIAQDARFQRLVSLYALKDKNLIKEIDAFLEKSTNPKERTQAMLLKGETLFRQGDYANAGKIYESLLAKDLESDLQADALYKLSWCMGATENYPAAISRYSEFLDKYPNHALAPTALAQRAIAKQQNKTFDAAIEDFDLLISKYPNGKERELALQQKALIYGQQQNYDAMSKAFRQLLEEFPKSAAAAQANFWLGWAAFEGKDYKTSIELLSKARELDTAQYQERSSLRIILALYYLQDHDAVAREAANYKGGNLPAEITLWLALRLIEEGNDAKAEALLVPLARNAAGMPPEAWINLAEAQIRLGKFQEAQSAVNKFLESARDPATRARGLLANARIYLGTKNFSEAGKVIEEALLLQPEGRLNAEARIASGDLLLAQLDFDGAARAYMTVSVLIDDPVITPRALQLAADAYRRANNRFESERTLTELRQRFPNFQKSSKVPKNNP